MEARVFPSRALACVALSSVVWLAVPPRVAQAQPAEPEPAPQSEEPQAAAFPPTAYRCQKQPKSARYRITLEKDAELGDLIDWMMSVSCQKFIWDSGLRTRKVNVVAPEPVTLEEAYAAFYAALRTIGATVEPAGDYFKIVETTGLEAANLPIYGPGAKVPNDERIVTKVWRPPPQRTEEVTALLAALKTSSGSAELVGEVMIMTDTASRIRRVQRLLEELGDDATTEQHIYVYGAAHADPITLAEVVSSVLQAETPTAAGGSSASAKAPQRSKAKGKGKTSAAPKPATAAGPVEAPFRMTVDERTGVLITVATESQYGAIRRLFDEIDIPGAGAEQTLHVIELQHADAAEVQTVLTALATGNNANTQPKRGAAAPTTTVVRGDVKVTAHTATQTLVVSASMSDFAALKRVVDRIDRRRRQLYIEVYLLEVRSDRGVGVGVGGHFGRDGENGGLGFASSSPGGTSALGLAASGDGAGSLLGGLSAGLLGPTIPGSGALLGTDNDVPAFGVMLQALETREDVNVVAEPHMYAAENEASSVQFGETVPVRSGVGTLPGSAVGSFSPVENMDVSLSLEVTPHVADDETVTFDIVLEDKQLGARDAEIGGYATTKRRLDLKQVIAYPEQPIVLGGMTKETDKVTTSAVPGLGSIPVLGWLFKKKDTEKEKVSLLMVMVPHFIDTPDDARRVHRRRMRERMEFLQRYTAFKRRDLSTHVNYRKKSGLLASINVAVGRQEKDAELRAAAEAELRRERPDHAVLKQPIEVVTAQ